MRLLLAIDHWSLIGGSERYAGAVGGALAARGHEVAVLCARADGARRGLDASIPVFELAAFAERGSPRQREREIRAAIGGFAPDVVFVLTCQSAASFEALLELAPLARFVQDHTLFCPAQNKFREDGRVCLEPQGLACLRRYYFTSGCTGYHRRAHGGALHKGVTMVARKLSEFGLAKRAARLFTASEYMRGELLRAGADPERCSVIPYFTRSNTPAIPRGPLPQAPAEFLERHREPLLFTPARLTLPDKGVDYLLTALAKLREPFAAVIAGDGPARGWLEAKARAENLAERVHFAGWLDAGAIETLYARSRAMVCPSIWNEPFGLVGLEAMAHAKPAIAFEVGGIPEWLAHERTGLLARRGDTDALARNIDRVLGDERYAAILGQQGRVRLDEDFNEARHLAELERELASLCVGSVTGPSDRSPAPRRAASAP
jgi:glycosyltransferase involved in cell wall biosynthesis